MASHTAAVPARVGLLGNPSDGYGGRVIAATVAELTCRVTGTESDAWRFGDGEGSVLVQATVDHVRELGTGLVDRPLSLHFETDIPRQAGLSGSSAIIIGVLHVLAAATGEAWDPIDLARTAFEVEVDRLGWTAGPQDRVIQAHGGLLDMDFAQAWDAAGYARLEPGSLPPLVLAWGAPGTSSDRVHADVRRRWLDGDDEVRVAMRRFAALAAEARHALDQGAGESWVELMNEAFDLRCRFWSVSSGDRSLVAVVRRHGGGASLAGSGGAVVGTVPDPDRLEAVVDACRALGAQALVPTVGPPHP